MADSVEQGRHPLGPAILVAMSGGVASGKSTLARALAGRLGFTHIEADRVRRELLEGASEGADPERGHAPHEAHQAHEAHWERSFEPGFEDRVYAELLRQAEVALAAGSGLILDACFPSRWWRGVARALARRHGLPFLLVECRVDPDEQRRRLALRDAAGARQGWQSIAARFARRYEPVEELSPAEHVAVESSCAVEAALQTVEARIPPIEGEVGAPPRGAFPLPRPPEAVTFDCWNTLVYEDDWPVAHAQRVDAVVHAVSVPRADAERAFDAAWARHMDQWQVGIATGAREVAFDVLATLGVEADVEILDALVREYQNASHSGRVLALDGAVETLERLVREGVRCALVCDTGLTPGHVVRLHLSRLGLLEHLELQIFSDEAGVPKPDARVFRAALEPLGVAPDRALHVGDLRRTDVVGARAVGMGTVRIRARHDDRSPLPEADAVVDDHAGLRALLLPGAD